MSDTYTDLLNKTAKLGQAQGDLALARSAEAGSHMQASSANRRAKTAEKMLDKEAKAHEQTKRDLAEAQAMIIDWMHSNEAFKILARKYGKNLTLSDEQRNKDFEETMINLAKEDPMFRESGPLQRILARSAGQ